MASDLLLSERMNDLVLKIRYHDLTWRIPAHSLLLVNKSPVFQEMMEERGDDERPIQLSFIGVKPDTILAVLKYIYEDEYPTDVTADLLIASQKYGLKDLQDRLEERLMSDMTLLQACQIMEELLQRQSADTCGTMKIACQNLLERHGLAVFASDLVLQLGKMTLTLLLQSDGLNVPDEEYVFWGVWRWGRKKSSMNNRSLRDEDVQMYIDDLLVLLKANNVKCKENIPKAVYRRFSPCNFRRCYYCPPDILKHSTSFRPCTTFEDIIPGKSGRDGPVCVQISVEKDVMLVGVSLELCVRDELESVISVIRESDCVELRRQRVGWCQTRRMSSQENPECRLEAEVTFTEPLFLTPRNVYSIQLTGNFSSSVQFVWGSFRQKRVKVGNTFVNLHGEGVTSLREIYLIPDVNVTWGPRGPTV